MTEQMSKPAQAYERGLVAFRTAVKTADPKDAALFQEILTYGISSFGIKVADLAERVGSSKGTISKWTNQKALPSQPAREVILGWMLEQIDIQLNELHYLDGRTRKAA